jgi:hypothetical protein
MNDYAEELIKCAPCDDPVRVQTSWVTEYVYCAANCNWVVVCYIYSRPAMYYDFTETGAEMYALYFVPICCNNCDFLI